MQPPRRPEEPIRRYKDSQFQQAPQRSQPRQDRRAPQRPPSQEPNWLLRAVPIKKYYVVGILLMAGVFAILIAVNDAQVRNMRATLEATQKLVSAANYEVSDKERQLQFSTTEEYIEREARERFGYIKPGETRFLPSDYIPDNYEVSIYVPQVETEATGEESATGEADDTQ